MVTLGMADSLGSILCSGPSDIAVDNFAERTEKLDDAAVAHINQDKAEGKTRYRRKVIIQANTLSQELMAFKKFLEDPSPGNGASPETFGRNKSKWQSERSLAAVALRTLGSHVGRPLDGDDSLRLHELRHNWEKADKFAPLILRAQGKLGWDQFVVSGWNTDDALESFLQQILVVADLLFTTPSAGSTDYSSWKFENAKGFAVDDANNMTL